MFVLTWCEEEEEDETLKDLLQCICDYYGDEFKIFNRVPHSPDLLVAWWTLERGWKVTPFGETLENVKELLLVHELGIRLFCETESLEPIALDLAYLYPAIIIGNTVQWEEPTTGPEDESDRYTNIVKLFRHLFPSGHTVWEYIEVV